VGRFLVSEWRDTDAISVPPQRQFVVTVYCQDGRAMRIRLSASSIETVIDQVRGRRIALPSEVSDVLVHGADFEVAEDSPA
jgi:hypothetical protein